MKMTMTATGDSILIQGYPKEGYPGFEAVRNFLLKGQARFGNLETCITDFDTYCSSYCGGTWLNAEPRILDQILAYELNFLGFANNHSMDFGPDGLLETLDHINKRGVAVAGSGKDLYEASKPVFRTFPAGRVAFISVASSISSDAARAGYASRTLKGRPGINTLRFQSRIMVNKEHFEALQSVAAATKLNGRNDLSRKNGFAPALPEGDMDFGGLSIRLAGEGEKEEVVTTCHKRDLARVMDAIKDASYIADYTVVMFHGHEIKGDKMSEPADFHTEFAHACIDAGACAFIGTGTHEFKPLELYKGKPIFYSLGNFCYQSNVLERLPEDLLDRFNFEPMSDIQAIAKRNKDWTVGLHTQYYNFRTVIPYMEFDGKELVSLEMMPVELGFDKPRTFKGIPYPADKAVTAEIFETLHTLSEPYGTKLALEGGIIKLKL